MSRKKGNQKKGRYVRLKKTCSPFNYLLLGEHMSAGPGFVIRDWEWSRDGTRNKKVFSPKHGKRLGLELSCSRK